MAVLRIKTGDFLRRVGLLRNAKDSYGNRLYTDEEVAGFFGMRDAYSLDRAVKETMTKHREKLIARAKQLKGEGYPNDRIDERLGLSSGTTEILLDDDGNARIVEVVKVMTEARENFTKEMNEAFKFNESLFH